MKLSEAIVINQEVIRNLLDANGPTAFHQIVYECQQQGYAAYDTIDAALQVLLSLGVVTKELIEPDHEGDDQYYAYELT